MGDGGVEEGEGGGCAVGLHDRGEGQARGVVDADMDELPADTAAVALALAVTGDAVADLIEFAELFDVDVDHLARPLALVAAGAVSPPPGAPPACCPAPEQAAPPRRRPPRPGGGPPSPAPSAPDAS